MLQVHHVSKRHGILTVLDDVTLALSDGEHAGLIGPNGAGKTTLLRCITGEDPPDTGAITLGPDQTVGYLPQTVAAMESQTVRAVVDAARADLTAAEAAAEAAAERLAAGDDPAAYDAALARFEALGGYARLHRAESVLAGLRLDAIDGERPVASLSGGQKTRLGLALLLLREPDVLILDEPTNHLDVEALEWLEGFVRGFPGAALIVSHDRAFLDRTVTRILYLDQRTRTVTSYAGNYSDFAAARRRERAAQAAAWQDQQLYIRETEADIRRVKGLAQTIQNGPKRHRDHFGRVSAKVARLARARERKLERFLESEERVEKPRRGWGLKLDFGPPPSGARSVLSLDRVAFAYPGAQPLFREASVEVRYGDRVAVTGPNGAGKTTLLRLIEGRLAPTEGGVRLGTGVRVGVLSQEGETLDLERSVLQTALAERAMSETEARNFLHYFLFAGDAVFRRVGDCSMGERTRLQLARLVLRGCTLLLLDEPLNHLDIEGREHFEAALEAYAGTVIAVAHDRAFLHGFARRVLDVRNGRIRVIEGGYDWDGAQPAR